MVDTWCSEKFEEETKFHRFVDEPWESSHHLFIISIRGKAAGGGVTRLFRDVYTSPVCVYTSDVFSVCNLSSFRDGKGNVCFLILTCHLRSWIMYAAYAPTLEYDDLEYVVRIYRGQWYNRLFIATRFLFSNKPLCKRSWIIISRLSNRDIAAICLVSKDAPEIFIDASFSWV